MNKKLFKIVFAIIIPIAVAGQPASDINQTDASGKKQGRWIRNYPNNVVMYDGFFKDDYPEGEFKRYYQNSILQSVMIFSNEGTTADVKIYHPNGFLAAQGIYVNQQKEGLWQFYSSVVDGYLLNKESYSNNLRNGESVKLYHDGTVGELMNYENDIAWGEMLKYHPNGNINLKTTMINGKIDGKFEAWFDDGQIQFSGAYQQDKKEGKWLIYERDGSLRYEVNYVNGMTNDRQMDIDIDRYLDMLEQNEGNILDPEQTDEVMF
jgi:antitoxin component YwqK of YwqJK toxin-antitoxin module